MLATHRVPHVVAAALMFVAFGCAPSESPPPQAEAEASGSNRGQAYVDDESSEANILRIAMSSPDHTTLVAAVQAAELENVLVNAGPLTVFAPTDEAFAALPEGTLEELLKPENKSVLAKIVTSHAAPGKYMGDVLAGETSLYQATGHYVDVEVRDGESYVNGARILGTIEASNGVVHVVDKVFLIAAPQG